ncbi:MAG TPA: Glu/Leu/Phe/Val dehydrogenase dimerization domain-containing protein [Solirubrobacterales bacterium]|jgi:leucine dehydrogenase|nr:Glu/Leu/Phe/Val dehydrogenase dimerization domain-containing protein [Solirubrobacterales bacterium]
MAVATHKPTNGRPTSSATAESAAPEVTEAPGIPPVPFDHEQLAIRRGDRSGLYSIVAIHSTALGPALGGVRLWGYPATIDAARDALRLAMGMTYKAAAARLDLGGGKGVICAPPGTKVEGERRRAALLDFGDLVESLGGRYITAEDVGICPDDLIAIRERTEHVTGLPSERGGSGDPSPFTAMGVEAAMRACCKAVFGEPDLAGRTVAVVGLGHVGSGLAQRLAEAGARLVVSDIVPARRALADELGAAWVDPGETMLAECDVLAPCALGGAVHAGNVADLRCRVVCGSANNQLADESLAGVLAQRDILYAPDFIANAGGLIHVYMEITGYSEERATELALGIEETLGQVLATAAERSITPLDAARELARERLDAAAAPALRD